MANERMPHRPMARSTLHLNREASPRLVICWPCRPTHGYRQQSDAEFRRLIRLRAIHCNWFLKTQLILSPQRCKTNNSRTTALRTLHSSSSPAGIDLWAVLRPLKRTKHPRRTTTPFDFGRDTVISPDRRRRRTSIGQGRCGNCALDTPGYVKNKR